MQVAEDPQSGSPTAASERVAECQPEGLKLREAAVDCLDGVGELSGAIVVWQKLEPPRKAVELVLVAKNQTWAKPSKRAGDLPFRGNRQADGG